MVGSRGQEYDKDSIGKVTDLDARVPEETSVERLKSILLEGQYSSFQEGTITILRQGPSLVSRFSHSKYMWLIDLLEGKVAKDLEVAQSLLKGMRWDGIAAGDFHCVIYRGNQTISIVGIGKIFRDSYWRVNPSGFQMKVESRQLGIKDILDIFSSGENVLRVAEFLLSEGSKSLSLKGQVTPINLYIYNGLE